MQVNESLVSGRFLEGSLGCSRCGSGRFVIACLEWVVVPLRETVTRYLCFQVACWAVRLWPLSHLVQSPLPSVVRWIETLADFSMQMALAPQFSWQLLPDGALPAA
jgi:hypothetical protein